MRSHFLSRKETSYLPLQSCTYFFKSIFCFVFSRFVLFSATPCLRRTADLRRVRRIYGVMRLYSHKRGSFQDERRLGVRNFHDPASRPLRLRPADRPTPKPPRSRRLDGTRTHVPLFRRHEQRRGICHFKTRRRRMEGHTRLFDPSRGIPAFAPLRRPPVGPEFCPRLREVQEHAGSGAFDRHQKSLLV
jgi:hypothetical protein